MLEDASPDADAPYEGKLKDALKFMGKTSKNMLFKTLMEEEEMKNMHPVRFSDIYSVLILRVWAVWLLDTLCASTWVMQVDKALLVLYPICLPNSAVMYIVLMAMYDDPGAGTEERYGQAC